MDVVVVMSSYKGGRNIGKQVESILQQIGDFNLTLYIRDDGSPDNTVEAIKSLQKKLSNIILECGLNEGYARSFWDGLKNAPDADYYAFSDQDDVWKPEKLSYCIAAAEKIRISQPEAAQNSTPILSYCDMCRSDEELHTLEEQVQVLKPYQLSKKLTLTQTYCYGAATVFNRAARNLICRCWPTVDDFPHDMWAGMLCYWFGKVCFVDERLYYWIRYGSSVTGEGTKSSGIRYRIQKSLNKKSYPNVSKFLLEYYGDLLDEEDEKFLHMVYDYKKNPKHKRTLLLDKNFRRASKAGTLTLKLGILFNWF